VNVCSRTPTRRPRWVWTGSNESDGGPALARDHPRVRPRAGHSKTRPRRPPRFHRSPIELQLLLLLVSCVSFIACHDPKPYYRSHLLNLSYRINPQWPSTVLSTTASGSLVSYSQSFVLICLLVPGDQTSAHKSSNDQCPEAHDYLHMTLHALVHTTSPSSHIHCSHSPVTCLTWPP
jgi:hypothetical protein